MGTRARNYDPLSAVFSDLEPLSLSARFFLRSLPFTAVTVAFFGSLKKYIDNSWEK